MTTPRRRLDDRHENFLAITSGEEGATGETQVTLRPLELGDAPVRGLPEQGSLARAEEAAFILDDGQEDVLLVAGASLRRIPRGKGEKELLSRAAKGAAAWRRERGRVLRRMSLPKRLIEFTSEIAHATTREQALSALERHTAWVVGGYQAILFVPNQERTRLLPFQANCALSVYLDPDPALSRGGVVTPDQAAPGTGGPFDGLAPLFSETGAAQLAYLPVEEEGVLVLVERRDDRHFDAEDWNLLHAMGAQTSAALERARLFQQVRELSLSDPLTGLANRRQLSVFLEHALAAARRGQPLTLVMLDLDGFKEVNDSEGHASGDRLLCEVADVLREEVRGSDLVLRYGGDEFLVLMPGGSVEGANKFVERFRARLGKRVGVSAGVAEYNAEVEDGGQLIEMADWNLYAAKNRIEKGKAT
ncbi:MAG: diguanylate cyclase [Longimicrobiaceae bacterium]